ncbi:MAG: hypothetical protein ACK5ZH_00750 [Alphaproteobacteria bacterium]
MQAQEVTLPPAADFATAAPVVNDPIYAGTPPPIAPLPPAPPVSRFIEQNRIHVEHGSVFDSAYLVVHPRELAPERETNLRKKLDLTYSIDNPSFFEDHVRMMVALQMGQYFPVSLDAKRSQLMDSIKKFNEEVASGQDASLKQQAEDRNHPMAAILRETIQKPEIDPVGLAILKNSMAMYLLCRERLTQRGYLKNLPSYIKRGGSPEQVFNDLKEELGVTSGQIQDAALKGGIDAVGNLLQLDPRFVADVKKITELSSTHDFSHNLVEHWHIGRQKLGLEAGFEQKIAAGKNVRIDEKIKELRNKVHHQYDVPEPIRAEEARIAEALKLVHPSQLALLDDLGYELCYSPEMTAGHIAFHPHVYGLHRKAANDMRDLHGTYRIYFSGHGDLKNSMRTLVHEITHNLWPDYFSPEEITAIDRLAASDRDHIRSLATLMNTRFDDFAACVRAYHAGNDVEKAAVLATMNEEFGMKFDALISTLKDPYELLFMVKHADDRLHVEGDLYAKSGYGSPQERFREVFSRFSELKLVELRDNQPLLEFIAPGLCQVFSQYYIPHLDRVRQALHQPRLVGAQALAPTSLPVVNRREEVPPKVKVTNAANDEPPNVAAVDRAVQGDVPDTHVSARSIRQLAPAIQVLDNMGVHARI